jgi:hypothetical protein
VLELLTLFSISRPYRYNVLEQLTLFSISRRYIDTMC